MSDIKQMKQAVVDQIAESITRSKSAVFYDYRGLNVAEVTELRKQCRQAGVDYKVLKNTMITRAAQALEIEGLDPILKGPTAVAFSYDDPVVPAKLLSDYVKKIRKTEIKGALLGRDFIDLPGVEALADMPSKEVLVARLMGSLNAPTTNLVGVLAAVPRALVTALDAIGKKKQEQGA